MIDHFQCWFSLITYLGFQYIKHTCVLADLNFCAKKEIKECVTHCPLVWFLLAGNVFWLFLNTVAIVNILFFVMPPQDCDFSPYNGPLISQIITLSEQTSAGIHQSKCCTCFLWFFFKFKQDKHVLLSLILDNLFPERGRGREILLHSYVSFLFCSTIF